MKRSIGIIIVILAVVLSVYSVGHSAPKKMGEKTIVLKYASPFPPDHIMEKPFSYFLSYVEKEANGRVTFERHYGGTLVAGPDLVRGCLSGLCDIAGHGWGPIESDLFPGWHEIRPFLLDDTAVVAWADNDFHREFTSKIAREHSGVEILFDQRVAPYQIWSTKPIKSMDDFKGRKGRGTGLLAPKIEGMGGIPVGITPNDAVIALQRGALDFSPTSISFGVSSGYQDVCKYLITGIDDVDGGIGSLFMNYKVYSKLPQDVKDMFSEARKAAIVENIRLNLKVETDALKVTKAAGVSVTKFPPEEKAKLVKLMREKVWPVLQKTYIDAGWANTAEMTEIYYEKVVPAVIARGDTKDKYRKMFGYE